MGIEFSGETHTQTKDGVLVTRLLLGFEHPDFFHLNIGNAVAVLNMLRLPCDHGYGECTMPEARRAIMQARARFERTASEFTRETIPMSRPSQGRARFASGGLDEDGLMLRLEKFARFVDVMTVLGATLLRWS